MTHDEIMAMAREADPFGDDGRLVSLAMLTPGTLERFAALVAAEVLLQPGSEMVRQSRKEEA